MNKFDTIVESVVGDSNFNANLLEFCLVMDQENILTEGTTLLEGEGRIDKMLGKAGLHIGRSDGLIQMLAKSGKQFGKVLLALWKARKGGDDAKANLKQVIEDSKISKEQFLDFLLKLDQATLHMITGPLHLLDAVMGWHIAPHVAKKTAGMADKIKSAFDSIAHTIKDLPKNIIKKIKPAVDKAKNTFKAELNIG